MSAHLVDILRSLARPLDPMPTGISPVLARLPGIRAVLWDIYGTLVISGSGDAGGIAEAGRAAAIEGTWQAMGFPPPSDAGRVARLLEETIGRRHAAARAQGVDFPEVDIVDVWREVLEGASADEVPQKARKGLDVERLAVEYEARINPVWPMPGMVDCLTRLQAAGMLLGVISNAQHYTPFVFPALTGRTLEELGVAPALAFYSFRVGHAKPGRRMFDEAAAALATRGIEPAEVLYVGNDMLKDVLPASRSGFRTALFAGDQRSLRLREEDERVRGVVSDLIVTELGQIPSCAV